MRSALTALALSFSVVLLAAAGWAHEDHGAERIEELTVRGRPAPAPTASSSLVREAEAFELRPFESPAQLLEVTPGLITAQHAGGGKSDQLLMRGFDADHGTDIAVLFDDMPVNLRSHAHGQGYTDLHFVIPETVERLDIFKGPYDARVGDFATAGAIRIIPRLRVERSFAKLEAGDYDTLRAVAAYSPTRGLFAGSDPRATLLLAAEGYWSDGPFDPGESLARANVFGRASYATGPRDRVEAWMSYYRSHWNASGQIPQRAVDRGLDRFGRISPREGGDSNRWSGLMRYRRDLRDGGSLEVVGWLSRYELDLFSNFTFALQDPVRGDAIVQRDDRFTYGGRLEFVHVLGKALGSWLTLGGELRVDDADVRLGPQHARRSGAPGSDDPNRSHDIWETSLAGYAQVDLAPLDWLRVIGGLRVEEFRFSVKDRSGLGGSGGRDADMVALPKANLILSPFSDSGPWPAASGPLRDLEIFLNYGTGYHSNDARDVVAHSRETTLPRGTGYEIGLRTRLTEGLELAVSVWQLDLEGEFVFVGDAGVTEPRGRSRRRGLELSARWELASWLQWDLDGAYSMAEFADGTPVPQAPRTVLSSGLTARSARGWSADLRARYLGPRDATPSRAGPKLHSYTVWDAGFRYRRDRWALVIKLENIFNTQWESAEFYYASRLPGEPAAGVEDFHFTPGNERNLRAGITWYF